MIFTIAIVMAVLAPLSCVTNIVATTLSAKISTKFAADIRSEIFCKVQDFSAAEMDKFGTASLVTRSTSDVTNVQAFLTVLLRIGVMAPLMAVAGLVLSSVTGGKVSSVLNTAIPVLIICSGIIILIVSRYSGKMRKKIDQLNKLFLETLEGVRVIRAFSKQEHEINRFADVNQEYTNVAVISGRVSGLLMPVIQVIFGFTTAAVMTLGSYYVANGEMDVGALVANSQYISMILMAIILLSAVIMMFPISYACVKRIAEVLETENSIRDGKKSVAEKELTGTVEFQNVTFSYPGADEPVISNISFEAHPGEITAIIGRTGCGKSSILKLIPRLYDPTVGHVLIDGIDAKKYQIAELRNLIGYVPQKNVLFSGDIASNLNFGNQSGNETDWEEALQTACADGFIRTLPGAYDMRLSKGAENISQGERQLLTIARAMAQLMKGRTSFVIAHRLSTIKDADMILYMENGDIKEVGNHDSLMELNGKYAMLYNSQFA